MFKWFSYPLHWFVWFYSWISLLVDCSWHWDCLSVCRELIRGILIDCILYRPRGQSLREYFRFVRLLRVSNWVDIRLQQKRRIIDSVLKEKCVWVHLCHFPLSSSTIFVGLPWMFASPAKARTFKVADMWSCDRARCARSTSVERARSGPMMSSKCDGKALQARLLCLIRSFMTFRYLIGI